MDDGQAHEVLSVYNHFESETGRADVAAQLAVATAILDASDAIRGGNWE